MEKLAAVAVFFIVMFVSFSLLRALLRK